MSALEDMVGGISEMKTMKTKKKIAKSKLPYVILRCSGAGVHAGELVERGAPGGKMHVLKNARRIWRFNGAQTLSEVAVYGLNAESRVAPVVERQEIRFDDCHEIIHCQPAGRAAIEAAKEWRA
jgi:hypothetical protein